MAACMLHGFHSLRDITGCHTLSTRPTLSPQLQVRWLLKNYKESRIHHT